jgi:3',5'-cyclic AMP phosphodiesterase CpdA
MKIICISDLHGRDVWKQIKPDHFDKIIFLGDYLDSYTYPDQQIIENFTDIIAFTKQYPDKVVLLLGNHDIQYKYYPHYRCSGFRGNIQSRLTDIFFHNPRLFQYFYSIGPYLFSHAGVSTRWLKQNLPVLSAFPDLTLPQLLEALQASHHREILYQVGSKRGGEYQAGGIFWADYAETVYDYKNGESLSLPSAPGREVLFDKYLRNLHQVVGHSRVEKFLHYPYKDSSITYTDVLDSQTAFYKIL